MKKAWTLAELTVAIILIVLISGLCVHILKPNTQKSRIFVYAMLKNMNKGHSAIMEKYDDIALEDTDDNDWYCTHLADVFTLKGKPKCEKKMDKKEVNMTFSNGVTLQGLANPWETPYEDATYTMKNIMLDIDGSNGPNKIWVDRFPLKVLKGGKYTGTIRVVDCSDETVYDNEDKKVTLTDGKGLSPYCKQKFDVSGASVNKGINKKSDVVTYDIYRAATSEEGSKAILISAGLPVFEADCAAYAGNGIYNKKECALNSIKIAYKCATTELCSTCATTDSNSICPVDPDNNDVQTNADQCATVAEKYNPDSAQCFILLHKPNVGMPFLLDTIIGEINM